MMKVRLFCSVLFFCSFPIFAAQNDWVTIFEPVNSKSITQYKKGSFERKVGNFGTVELTMLTRVVDHGSGRITFIKYSVIKDDCSSGYGQLWMDFMDGMRPLKATFVSGGGNGSAAIADLLCSND